MKMKKGLVWTIGVVGAVVVLTIVALVAQNAGFLGNLTGHVSEIAQEEYIRGDYDGYETKTKKTENLDSTTAPMDKEESMSLGAAPPEPSKPGSDYGSGYTAVKADLKDYTGYTKQMLNKNGTIAIESEDPMAAMQKCSEVVLRFGGDILNSNTSYYGNSASVSMTLRVPVGNFEKAVNEIQKAGKVTSINTTAEDVTSEYINLDASRKTKEKMIKQLNTLLDNARNEEAMVRMYEKIAQYEQELESIIGQQKYLEGMTSFSRINITISKPGVSISYPEDNEFMEALKVVWRAFLTAVLWILVVLVVGLPILGFILLIVWIVKLAMKSGKPIQPQA